MAVVPGGWHDGLMLNLRQLQDQDLQVLAPEDVLALAQQMLAHIQQQEREIKLKDVKIEKITFELARLKAWKFGAKTEAMSAEQRRLFEETLAEDEASLQAQLQDAKGEPSAEDNTTSKRTPRRQPLPAHQRRVEYHHEPEDTQCPTPGCGRAGPAIDGTGRAGASSVPRGSSRAWGSADGSSRLVENWSFASGNPTVCRRHGSTPRGAINRSPRKNRP